MGAVDDGIEKEWPTGVHDALGRFRQGHLIADPPLAFHGIASSPLWTPPDVQRPAADGPVDLAGYPYAIITTQTCNIAERPPGGVQPWIQISPVYELAEGEDRRDRIYLHPLTAAGLGSDRWVADLRLEVPVEKGILLEREPVDAFADEDGAIQFAEMLGRQRDRAALHDVINKSLYGTWRRKRANNKKRARPVFESIHMVGLLVEEGTRLEPIAVELHLVGRDGPIPDEHQKWLNEWWDVAREKAEQENPALRLLPNTYHDGTAMNLTLYDELIALDGWLET
jgi:hypothetical protein